jgi:hypothetical protein
MENTVKVPFDTVLIKEGDRYKIDITDMVIASEFQEGDTIRIMPSVSEIWFLRKK